MYQYEGFGILTDNLEPVTHPYNVLYKMVEESNSSLKEMLMCFYEENLEDYSCEEESFFDFCEDYEDFDCGCGPEAVVCRLVNEEEYDGKRVFIYEDLAVHVPTYIPVDENDKWPTQKEIQKILEKYFQPFYKSKLKADWLTVTVD